MKKLFLNLSLCLLLVLSLCITAGAATLDTANLTVSGNKVIIGAEEDEVLTALHESGRTAKIAIPFTHTGDDYYVVKDGTEIVTTSPEWIENQTFIRFPVHGAGTYEIKKNIYVTGMWGNNISWVLEDGTLTISGTGDMLHYTDPNGWLDPTNPMLDGYTWHYNGNDIISIVVEEGITSLEEIAFHGLKNLSQVTLPTSLTKIGGAAFAFCPALERITIPENVSEIGIDAFLCSTSFKEITFTGNAPTFDAETFKEVTATAYYPANNSTWTESIMQDYGGDITWKVQGSGVPSRVDATNTEIAGYNSVWVDGVEYPVQKDGSSYYVDLPDTAKSMTAYGYHEGDPDDVHTQYPVSMKVWMLSKNADGSYDARQVEELDDILQYSGSSIRVTGNKGIRMITSVPMNKKTDLTGNGLAGYSLVEYGTVLARASDLSGGKPLTLGQPYARSNYAYKRGVADPVFNYDRNLVQYTNVLVGFTMSQCDDDIAMRSYMILEDADGNQVTLYGGIVYRSIGYIAYQNRDVFTPGSDAYHYVWDIIHYVYGDQYDAEYKG